MLHDLENHSTPPDYSGNAVSKFQVELINIQGEIASDKNLHRNKSLENQTKLKYN